MNENLLKAYTELAKEYEKKLGKEPKLRKDLDKVTLNNPQLLLAEGYRQLQEESDEN